MPFPLILLFVAVAALAVFYAYLCTPRGKGWIGEFRVKLIAGKTKKGTRYVINNLVLKIDEGKTSQIDHVVINRNGVFVIETKNYSGRIYGSENQLEWTKVLNYGRVKNKLYNPIKQNNTHVYHVSRLLKGKLPIYSAVVFVQGNVQFIEAGGVCSLSELKRLLNTPLSSLTPEEMESAYQTLLDANDKTVSLSQHVENISAMREAIRNDVCPRCGKQLVVRHGKTGDFMGCSGYPDCRFTKQLQNKS
ncbi:MAG: NERD domain-containing protein [Clostridia bacterium]|nr:NERD domain-containing protein [Clostridia bacterium]